MLVEAFQSFPTGKTKVKCTGMSEKFNPLQESCQIACVRACAEELKVTVSESGACKRYLYPATQRLPTFSTHLVADGAAGSLQTFRGRLFWRRSTQAHENLSGWLASIM